MQTYTINRIAQNVSDSGSHWFDYSTMKCFGTEPESKVYHGPGGVYFVTGDLNFSGKRGYTVRRYDPETNDITSECELASLTRAGAHKSAMMLAAGLDADNTYGVIVVSDKFKKQTLQTQLAIDIQRNGGRCNHAEALKLIRMATRHHQIMEDACNGVRDSHDEQGRPSKRLSMCESQIRRLVNTLHCDGSAVIFSGDLRGATVKLVLPSGKTNDMSRSGWCVPTLGE